MPEWMRPLAMVAGLAAAGTGWAAQAAPPELDAVLARVESSEMFLCRIDGDDTSKPFAFAKAKDGTLIAIAPWEGVYNWSGERLMRLTKKSRVTVVGDGQYVTMRGATVETGSCEVVTADVIYLLKMIYQTEPWAQK
ncbi:hypothetical protein [Rhodovulum sp. P5]|uniref:hypothetical protein n=1 Tax=Rhodovulum sp. P5 TaxID=1564506 RepID=UPI0009D967C2|nr:hypothetical protein [Rhodovulum sp. P5]